MKVFFKLKKLFGEKYHEKLSMSCNEELFWIVIVVLFDEEILVRQKLDSFDEFPLKVH
jgi:hypothetical protein